MGKTYNGTGKRLFSQFIGIIIISVIVGIVLSFNYFFPKTGQPVTSFENTIFIAFIVFGVALAAIMVLYYLKLSLASRRYTFNRSGLEIVSGIKTKKRVQINYDDITAVDYVIVKQGTNRNVAQLIVKTNNRGNFSILGLTKDEEIEFKNFLEQKIKKTPLKKETFRSFERRSEKSSPISEKKSFNKNSLLVVIIGLGAISFLIFMFLVAFQNLNINYSNTRTHFCDSVQPFNEQNLGDWYPYLEYNNNQNVLARVGDPGFNINNGVLEFYNTPGMQRTSISRRFNVDNKLLQDHKLSFSLENLQDLGDTWATPYFRIHYVDKNLNDLTIIYWVFFNDASAQAFTKNHPFYKSDDLKTISYTGNLLELLKEKAPDVNVNDVASIKLSAGAYGFGEEMRVQLKPISMYCGGNS